MMQHGENVEYLEYIDQFSPDYHVKLAHMLSENFELRFTWDLRDRSSQFHYLFISDSQPHEPQTLNGNIPAVEAVGIFRHYQFTYFRGYRLHESKPVDYSQSLRLGESANAQRGETWEMRWVNNHITGVYPASWGVNPQTQPSWGGQYTDVQSGFNINEFWFAAQSGNRYTAMVSSSNDYFMRLRKVEVYDNNALIETFLPARVNGMIGLYSDTQKILYPLYQMSSLLSFAGGGKHLIINALRECNLVERRIA